jgi:hypothetical protein
MTLRILVCFLMLSTVAFSQQPMQRNTPLSHIKIIENALATPVEMPILTGIHEPISNGQNRSLQIAGVTNYDLQTYNSLPGRYHAASVSIIDSSYRIATWMKAQTFAGGWPDRGTGISCVDISCYDADRIEATGIRSGFPASAYTEATGLVNVAHRTTAAPPYYLECNRLVNNVMYTSDLPTDLFGGVVWPAIDIAGPDDLTVHVVAINFAPESKRQLYYYRSLDGGVTWPVHDVTLAGLDTNLITYVEATGYAIRAKGNHVAVAVFGTFNDSYLLESTDNGDNWTKTKFFDFPLDNYQIDQGYTYADIPHTHGADQYDSLTIFTTDNTGDLWIDDNEDVHIFYGTSYVLDALLTDTLTQYFPASSGMNYWRTGFSADSVQIVADLVDFNGNDTIDVLGATLPTYGGNSLTSHPTITEMNGVLYMVYMGMAEFTDSDALASYHHLYGIYSEDNGLTWSAPQDLVNTANFDEFFMFNETVYPSLIAIDGRLSILFQNDPVPGSFIASIGDLNQEVSEHEMTVLELGPFFAPLIVGSEDQPYKSWSVSPNPAQTEISIIGLAANNYDWQVVNAYGQVVSRGQGIYNSFDISQLANGVYQLLWSTETSSDRASFMVVR